MKKAAVIVTAILAVIFMLGFGFLMYLGGDIVYYYTDSLMDIVYDVLLVSLGIMIAVTVIPTLICDIVQYRKKKNKRDLLLSLGLALVGVVTACYGIVELVILFGGVYLIMEIEDALGASWNVEDMIATPLRIVRWLVAAPAALYLVAVPLVRMIFTKERALQYRVFLYQPVLGGVLLALTALGSVVVMLQRPTGTVMKVLGFALAAFAVAYLIAALAGLSKAVKRAKEREKEREEKAATLQPYADAQPIQKKEIDLPFNLPAGVSADDL